MVRRWWELEEAEDVAVWYEAGRFVQLGLSSEVQN